VLERLASFVYRNKRRVLLFALLGIAVAGVFGLGVAKRLSPYGDTDPSTQSVQATNRYEGATGRQIDPGLVAIVTVRDVHSATAERRVRRVEAELRSSRDVATVSSYYDSRDPAMVARDGRSTYVLAYFQPKSDLRIQDDAKGLESDFAGQRDVELGGGAIANAQVNTQVGKDLARAELFAFPIIFLLSLLFFRSLVASLLPPSLACSRSSSPSSRCESCRASPTCRCSHRASSPASVSRAGDRLQPVHGLPLPRGGRPHRLRRRRPATDARDLGPDDRVPQLATISAALT
jgi:uncharacterized membrane protein YdfJ with MMPL/SSD domain